MHMFCKAGFGAATLAALVIASAAQAAEAKREAFGKLADGTVIEAVTLTGKNGVSARIISFGATLQALNVPDRSGKILLLPNPHLLEPIRRVTHLSHQS